jgi:hypothetical protein
LTCHLHQSISLENCPELMRLPLKLVVSKKG